MLGHERQKPPELLDDGTAFIGLDAERNRQAYVKIGKFCAAEAKG